jgi:hypothetical protein
MLRYISLTVLVSAITLLTPQLAAAQPVDYQMLPPTYLGTPTPCTVGPGGLNQVLIFGGASVSTGQSAVNCLNGLLTVDPASNFVSIGGTNPQTRLDVTGPMRSVDTSTDCTSSIEGAIRFNSSSKIHETCMQVSSTWKWIPFGGGSGVSCTIPTWFYNDGLTCAFAAVYAPGTKVPPSTVVGVTELPCASIPAPHGSGGSLFWQCDPANSGTFLNSFGYPP